MVDDSYSDCVGLLTRAGYTLMMMLSAQQSTNISPHNNLASLAQVTSTMPHMDESCTCPRNLQTYTPRPHSSNSSTVSDNSKRTTIESNPIEATATLNT